MGKDKKQPIGNFKRYNDNNYLFARNEAETEHKIYDRVLTPTHEANSMATLVLPAEA